jgi:hypothetical protein
MRFKLIALCALLACAVVGSAAAAGSTPAGGKIFIHATGGEGPAGTIVVVGAVADHGKTLQMTKNGKPDSNGNYVRITLQKGSFIVDSTKLNAAGNNARPQIQNLATCSFHFTATAPVKLYDGTGLYKGIAGTATITVDFGGYSRLSKAGKCSQNAPAVAEWGLVSGPGTVSFS